MLEGLRVRLLTDIKKGAANAAQWIGMIEVFERAREMLRTSTIPQLPLEIAVIKICTAGTLHSAATVTTKVQTSSKIVQQEEAPRQQAQSQPSAPSANIESLGERATVAVIKDELEMERYKAVGAIMQNWQRVVEHVNPPSLRRSLTQCSVQEVEGSKIVLIFSAEFHMEKVNGLEAKEKISQAVEHIFGRKVSVTCELRLTAVIQDESPKRGEASSKAISKKSPSASQDLAAKALEIFGDDGF